MIARRQNAFSMAYQNVQTAPQSASPEQIIRDHDAAITRLAGRFPERHRDDLIQIGRIALLEAAQDWKQGCQLWTYARSLVLGRMLRFVSREIARLNVEEDSCLFPCAPPAPDVVLEAKEHVSELSEREIDVLAAFLAGESERDIAESLRVSSKVVSRTLEKIRKHA